MPESPVSLNYLFEPPTINFDGKPPLLVLLHGVGSNEEDLMGLAPYLDGRFAVASLRAPLTLPDGGYGWYRIDWTADGIVHDTLGALAGQAAAERAIAELSDLYDADPAKIFLMGFSQGAILSLRIVLRHPEKYAGAVIMSGRLLPNMENDVADSASLSGFNVLVVHGTRDQVLPISEGRRIEQLLHQLPVSLTYKEYDMAHSVSQESLADVSRWLSDILNETPLSREQPSSRAQPTCVKTRINQAE